MITFTGCEEKIGHIQPGEGKYAKILIEVHWKTLLDKQSCVVKCMYNAVTESVLHHCPPMKQRWMNDKHAWKHLTYNPVCFCLLLKRSLTKWKKASNDYVHRSSSDGFEIQFPSSYQVLSCMYINTMQHISCQYYPRVQHDVMRPWNTEVRDTTYKENIGYSWTSRWRHVAEVGICKLLLCHSLIFTTELLSEYT